MFSAVILNDMPDPYTAKEEVWLPFLINDCLADSNTIIIGHSSGAEAAMRLLEQTSLLGVVLVSACHTGMATIIRRNYHKCLNKNGSMWLIDLGIASEAAAGYYNRPWNWELIKSNVGRFGIVQFHSADDPFIPMVEAQHVADSLSSEFHKYDDKSHFFSKRDMTEALEIISNKLMELLAL